MVSKQVLWGHVTLEFCMVKTRTSTSVNSQIKKASKLRFVHTTLAVCLHYEGVSVCMCQQSHRKREINREYIYFSSKSLIIITLQTKKDTLALKFTISFYIETLVIKY